MKHRRKLCIAAVLVGMAFSAGSLYAQEAKQPKAGQFSFGGSGIIALSDGLVSTGPGIQVSWVHPRLFRGFFGLGIHAGIIMPINGEEVGLGATLIAGPAMTVFDNGVFRIPVTAGVHADYIKLIGHTGPLMMDWVWNIGAGLNADFIWQFGKKWYVYGRLQLACNFGVFEALVSPGLGMGLAW